MLNILISSSDDWVIHVVLFTFTLSDIFEWVMVLSVIAVLVYLSFHIHFWLITIFIGHIEEILAE